MSNDAYLTLAGWVGSEVELKKLDGGSTVATFRIGSTPRGFDKTQNTWVDRPTTWFTVDCWRSLAQNVADSIHRGDPVVVYGRLKTSEWIENGEPRSRTLIEAFAVGHDLSRGTSTFRKQVPQGLGVPSSPFDDLPVEANPFSAEEAA